MFTYGNYGSNLRRTYYYYYYDIRVNVCVHTHVHGTDYFFSKQITFFE